MEDQLSDSSKYTGPTDVVYAVNEYGDAVFAERRKALYVAQLYKALQSETWAEFRATLPEGAWEDYLDRFGEYDDDGDLVDNFPSGHEKFDGWDGETGYPEWLAASMLGWFPDHLISKFNGQIVPPNFDGESSLSLPGDRVEEIASELRAMGCKVEPSPVDLI